MKSLSCSFCTIFLVLGVASCNHSGLDPDGANGSETTEFIDINVCLEQFDGFKQVGFDSEDQLALMFSKDNFSYVPYTEKSINNLKVGASRDIILVNPSRDGRVLAYDGAKEVVNNLKMKNMTAGEDYTAGNLATITDVVHSLSRSADYIFTLFRDREGFHIRHKDSGLGFTDKGEDEGSSCLLYWSNNAGPVEFSDAQEVKSKLNLVVGADCQLYIKSEDKILFSGRTSGVLRWFKYNPAILNGNTNWLVYNIPVMNYLYSAINVAGTKATFNGIKYADNTEYYAVYPYNKTYALEYGKINFPIGRVRHYVENGIEHGSNLSVGKIDSKGAKVDLENVFGILSIPVQGSQKVLSMEITDKSGDNLWGEAKVEASTLEFDGIKGGSSTCVLECDGGVSLNSNTPTIFSVVVPAGYLGKGFTLRIITDCGETAFEYNGVSIQRGKVLTLDTVMLSSADFDVPTYSIENDIVADYLSKVNYEVFSDVVFSSGCKSIFKSDYYDRVKSIWEQKQYRTDCPKKVEVFWETEDQGSVRVRLASNKDMIPTVRDTLVNSSQGCFHFTNLLPSMHYYYTVTNTEGQELVTGEFKTKGTLRMIEAEGSWNARDMGGMVSYEYGRRPVRYEQLYRGGSLNRITEKARVELQQIGIKAELDLRGALDPIDGQESGESISTGNSHTIAPLFTLIYGADYRQIMTDFAISGKYHSDPALNCTALVKNLAWIIYQLQRETPHPVYYHCNLGADRTNAVAYSIEALLGCSIADMARDYEITSFGYTTGMIDRYVTGNDTFHRCFAEKIEVPEGCTSLAQKMYYYFNQHFSQARISDKDLDWFIEYMLEMSDTDFQQYKSKWSWKTKSYETALEDIFCAPTIN